MFYLNFKQNINTEQFRRKPVYISKGGFRFNDPS